MSQAFFTSDTHFGHGFVSHLRGHGDDTAAHDEDIVRIWNEHVTKRDTVFHLGDVTLAPIARVAPLISRLNGTIHLISGNHDRSHPVFRRAHLETARYLDVFASVSLFARVRLHSALGDVLLSHFPYDGEGRREDPDRHVEYRLRDEGIPLIHGHTHDSSQTGSFSIAGTPMVHVGWDAWHRPVPADELAGMFG